MLILSGDVECILLEVSMSSEPNQDILGIKTDNTICRDNKGESTEKEIHP